MSSGETADLHAGFRRPDRAEVDALADFLHQVDRLPGIRLVHRAMRSAMELKPRAHLVDAGCGLGLETLRLAMDHPGIRVTGFDRNPWLLDRARVRAEGQAPNLRWQEADLHDLPYDSADVVRTERVLMYQPDLSDAVDRLLRVLRPGGRLVCFELDYGATLLPENGHAADVVRAVNSVLEASLPQPWAGRRLPGILQRRGCEVHAEPHTFTVSKPVWDRIVGDTLRQALAGDAAAGAGRQESSQPPGESITKWLDHQVNTTPAFLGSFTGVLTTAFR